MPPLGFASEISMSSADGLPGSFASLLKQLAAEHNREVTNLKSRIRGLSQEITELRSERQAGLQKRDEPAVKLTGSWDKVTNPSRSMGSSAHPVSQDGVIVDIDSCLPLSNGSQDGGQAFCDLQLSNSQKFTGSNSSENQVCCVPSHTSGRSRGSLFMRTGASLGVEVLQTARTRITSFMTMNANQTTATHTQNSMESENSDGDGGMGDAQIRTEVDRLLSPGDNVKADWGVISPVSKARLCWDLIAFFVLMLDMWLTPFELIYIEVNSAPEIFGDLGLWITMFWCADIVLNFTTGYIDRDRLVLKRNASVRKYLRFWFWVDLVATVPYDSILTGAVTSVHPGFLSMTRLAKITKVLKTVRFLKFFRAVRAVRNIARANHFVETFRPIAYGLRLLQVVIPLAFISHFHGCIWVALQPSMRSRPTMEEAMSNYLTSLRWSLSLLALGSLGNAVDENVAVVLYEMILASERIVALSIFGAWAVTKAMTIMQDDLHFNVLRKSCMRFFRKHHISIETQIQVMYSLYETRAAQVMQRHFQQLMDENLPDELRRTISEELWVPHLLSLGLIVHVKDWHSSFLTELSLRVREEAVASKTILYKCDTPSLAAYYVIEGRLAAVTTIRGTQPDFTPGMWVGEQCFVNPAVRRSTTIVARVLTRLMMVPAGSFHELINQLSLQGRFADFRDTQLAKGLCGRCGDVGDHFTHVCPMHGGGGPWRFRNANNRRSATKNFASGEGEDEENNNSVGQLQAYLHGHRLTSLAELLEGLGVATMDDLDKVEIEKLVEAGEAQRKESEVALLSSLIQERRRTDLIIFNEGEMKSEHLIFLSHFKIEAGTEAALMRGEIEQAMRRNGDDAIFEWFNSPIFLDSEDLYNLQDLQKKVRKSHNLVLLLTNNVLTRPWCLVELVTAVRHNVRILPVHVMKRGPGFEFPDEEFYTKLHSGEVLDESAEAVLKDHGIEMDEVEYTLRQVFQKIALPYSPHRSESIRRAEIQAVLKQVRPRASRVDGGGGGGRHRRPSRPEILQLRTVGSPDASPGRDATSSRTVRIHGETEVFTWKTGGSNTSLGGTGLHAERQDSDRTVTTVVPHNS